MSQALPYFKHFPAQTRADKHGLSTPAKAAYGELLEMQWERGPLPDDDDTLVRWSGLRRSEWARVRPQIRDLFRPTPCGRLALPWVEEQRASCARLSQTRAHVGAQGAAARALKTFGTALANASRLPGVCHHTGELESDKKNYPPTPRGGAAAEDDDIPSELLDDAPPPPAPPPAPPPGPGRTRPPPPPPAPARAPGNVVELRLATGRHRPVRLEPAGYTPEYEAFHARLPKKDGKAPGFRAWGEAVRAVRAERGLGHAEACRFLQRHAEAYAAGFPPERRRYASPPGLLLRHRFWDDRDVDAPLPRAPLPRDPYMVTAAPELCGAGPARGGG